MTNSGQHAAASQRPVSAERSATTTRRAAETATPDPLKRPPTAIMRLQRGAGNRATSELIQRLRAPADRGLAEAHLRPPEPATHSIHLSKAPARVLQRCGSHPCPSGGCQTENEDIGGEVTALGTAARPAVARSSPHSGSSSGHSERGDGQGAAVAPSLVETVLRTAGQPLDAVSRRTMESRFGHDFGNVELHTGAQAAQSAGAVGASAYTVGNHIVVGEGFVAGSAQGQRLLAHELVHVIQQEGAVPSVQGATPMLDATDPLENEAQVMADRVTAGGKPGVVRHPASQGIHRQPLTSRARARSDAGTEPDSGVRTDAGTIPDSGVSPIVGATRTFSLTFDDGPHAEPLGHGKNRTENVLDTLKARNIQAGFFVQTRVGFRMANPVGRALVARMHGEGHKVGIHTGGTEDHELHTTAQEAGRLKGELIAGKAAIKKITGSEPTLVRPPKMMFNEAVKATYTAVGLTNLLWDIDVDQGNDLSLAALQERVSKGIAAVRAKGWKTTTPSPTIVLLLHDIQEGTSRNLGAVIDHINTTVNKLSAGKDSAEFSAP
jgi:peptidoglycan/xylan/chitin deacetylase (PgdA/CDA1 family)